MPTLTPLKASGAGTIVSGTLYGYNRPANNVNWSVDAASNPFTDGNAIAARVDDGVAAYNQSVASTGVGLAAGGNITTTITLDLTSVDANFLSMTSLTFKCSGAQIGTRTDDQAWIDALVKKSDGTIIAAGSTAGARMTVWDYSGSSWTASPGYDQSKTLALTTAGESATKTDWDNAYVELRFGEIRSMGSDASAIILVDFEITGNYVAQNTGTSAQTLPMFSQAAAGTHDPPTAASILPGFSSAAVGTFSLTFTNTFEGHADATSITIANSGGMSGTAFNAVSGTVIARSATPALGNVYAELSTNAYVQWVTASVRNSGRMYVRLPSLPEGTVRLLQLRDPDVLTKCGISVNSSGNIRVLSGATTEVDGTVLGVSPGAWFRIEWLFTAAGAYTVHIFLDPHSESPDETLSGTTTIGPLGVARLGSTNNGGTVLLDSLLVSDVNALPGPATRPPTAVITADPTSVSSASTPISLSGTSSSDPDGTIVSYQWELVSGPSEGVFSNPTGSTTTFTPDGGA